MSWTERQAALLRAMGLRVWQSRTAAVVEAVGEADSGSDSDSEVGVAEPQATALAPAAPSLPPSPARPGSATRGGWLVVCDTPEPGPDRAPRLLDAMLRAVALARGDSVRVAGIGTGAGEAERAPPRVIVALGRPAAQALLGSDDPLGRLRGRVHDCRGVPLVVSYDLGYLLRNPHDKARAWDDLCMAAAAAEAAG